MRILGIDPGATCGWALLMDDKQWRGGKSRYLGFATLADMPLESCDMVAIEEPFVRAGTGPAGWAVGEACKVFGYLRGRIEASGLQVIPVAAGVWQSWLTGRSRGTKGMGHLVKAQLDARGMLPKSSNEHVRDALGLALYAAEGLSK